jgi:hypothetical protein
MKQEKLKPLDPIKKWIAEAGTDTPGDGFHLSVLRKIETQPKMATVYQPVISPLAWTLIFAPIASIIAWSILFAPAQQDNATILDALQRLKFTVPKFSFFDINFPSPDLSPQFLLGIAAFFILGFLMIIGTLRNKQADV